MVAGGQDNFDALLAVMPNYRHKKRHVRGIVEVDPNGFIGVFQEWFNSVAAHAAATRETAFFKTSHTYSIISPVNSAYIGKLSNSPICEWATGKSDG